MKLKWVPLMGGFEFKKDTIVFRGKFVEISAPESEGAPTRARKKAMPMPDIGLMVCNQQITDGTVSAEVVFEEVDPTSAFELILGYDRETRGFLSSGIPNYNYALFSIRRWYPGTDTGSQAPSSEQPRWIDDFLGGARGFLKPKQAYKLEASIRGARISLKLDGVDVATANLREAPNKPRQAGLWCMSHSNITINNFKVDAEKPRAFVVMHFAKPYDEVYSEVLSRVCAKFGLSSIRGDEIYGPGLIITDIVSEILRAQVIVADITPQNPNVYFEVGYALAWSKPIILLARAGTEIPFDVSGFRVLFYEDSIAGKAKLEEGLIRHLNAIFGSVG